MNPLGHIVSDINSRYIVFLLLVLVLVLILSLVLANVAIVIDNKYNINIYNMMNILTLEEMSMWGSS